MVGAVPTELGEACYTPYGYFKWKATVTQGACPIHHGDKSLAFMVSSTPHVTLGQALLSSVLHRVGAKAAKPEAILP